MTLGLGRHPDLVGADDVRLVVRELEELADHATALPATTDHVKHRQVAEDSHERDLYRCKFGRARSKKSTDTGTDGKHLRDKREL